MIADGNTKYVALPTWRRHAYYYMNKGVDYPKRPSEKDSKTEIKAMGESNAQTKQQKMTNSIDKEAVATTAQEKQQSVDRTSDAEQTQEVPTRQTEMVAPVMSTIKKNERHPIQVWADGLTTAEAITTLNKYKAAAKKILLYGKSDDLEVDASHLDSRGPILEARIALGD